MSTERFRFKRFEGWGRTCRDCGLVWIFGPEPEDCPHCARRAAEADLRAIDFHLDEYGTGNAAGLPQHKGSVRRAAIFAVHDLWAKLTRERARSASSREGGETK